MNIIPSLVQCIKCARQNQVKVLLQRSCAGNLVVHRRKYGTEATEMKKRKVRRMKAWHIHQYGGNTICFLLFT